MTSASNKNSGFKRICYDTWMQMRDGELQLVAASLSFSTILALVPFIAVVLSTLQIMGGGFELFYPKVEHLFLHQLREAAGPEAARSLRSILSNINAGKMGTTGAVFLLLTSLRLLHEMEVGIHRIWQQKITRPIYKRVFAYWLLILMIPLAMAVYISISSFEEISAVSRVIPRLVSDIWFLWWGLFMIYKWVPDINVHWKAALFSSGTTAIVLYSAQKGLGWATFQLFNYNKIYGSFAAIPIILLIILTTWYIILGGVALCAGIQKRPRI